MDFVHSLHLTPLDEQQSLKQHLIYADEQQMQRERENNKNKKFDKQDNNIMWNIFVITKRTTYTSREVEPESFSLFYEILTYFYSTIIFVRGIIFFRCEHEPVNGCKAVRLFAPLFFCKQSLNTKHLSSVDFRNKKLF